MEARAEVGTETADAEVDASASEGAHEEVVTPKLGAQSAGSSTM